MISKDKTKPPGHKRRAYRLNYQNVWTIMSNYISSAYAKVSKSLNILGRRSLN